MKPNINNNVAPRGVPGTHSKTANLMKIPPFVHASFG
jgi:hypothetical protein